MQLDVSMENQLPKLSSLILILVNAQDLELEIKLEDLKMKTEFLDAPQSEQTSLTKKRNR